MYVYTVCVYIYVLVWCQLLIRDMSFSNKGMLPVINFVSVYLMLLILCIKNYVCFV